MPSITIYTIDYCPYCVAAIELLKRKGADFEEINLTGNTKGRAELRTKAGGRHTVPQIWIGKTHVGGCDDLHALDAAGRLDSLLASVA